MFRLTVMAGCATMLHSPETGRLMRGTSPVLDEVLPPPSPSPEPETGAGAGIGAASPRRSAWCRGACVMVPVTFMRGGEFHWYVPIPAAVSAVFDQDKTPTGTTNGAAGGVAWYGAWY